MPETAADSRRLGASRLLRPRRTPRQQAVLDDLEALFCAEGFQRFTVADLSARLACSRRTLYELAPSRKELVLLVVDRYLSRLGQSARAAAADEDRADRVLEAFLTSAVQSLRQAKTVFLTDVQSDPAARALFKDHMAIGAANLRELVERGIEEGALRPVHAGLTAEIVNASMLRITDPTFLRAAGVTAETATAELTRLIVDGLRARPRTGRR